MKEILHNKADVIYEYSIILHHITNALMEMNIIVRKLTSSYNIRFIKTSKINTITSFYGPIL